MTVGYRVLVCENMAFSGDFQPVLAKHSKHFSLQNALSIGVDQMQRNFEPMVKAVDGWRSAQIADVNARLVIYGAFIEGALEGLQRVDRSRAVDALRRLVVLVATASVVSTTSIVASDGAIMPAPLPMPPTFQP